MNHRKRVLAFVLTLCMIIPMCLISVSADNAEKMEPVTYSLFNDSLKGSQYVYNADGSISYNKYKGDLEALYNSGAMKAIPYAFSSANPQFTPWISCKDKAQEKGSVYLFDGFRAQKLQVGDWVAIKFRSPGEGLFSVAIDYFYRTTHTNAVYQGYLLPGNTDKESIGSMLTEDNELFGTGEVYSATYDTINTVRITTSAEMNANQEYILVLKVMEDLSGGNNRIDLLVSSLTFGEGYEPGAGAFNPIIGKDYATGLVNIAEHYRAHTGINPANGHDLAYIMFKGKDMIVYDIDAREIVDIEENTINEQQKGSCLDPDGNLWICGAGDEIYKYDPVAAKVTMYEMDYAALGVARSQESYGITYGDDGWLYFGYNYRLMRLNPKTGVFEVISDSLMINGQTKSDIRLVGHGGVVYKDGFLYAPIYGDANADGSFTSAIIKYDIANRKIVQHIDMSDVSDGVKFQYKYGIRDLMYMDGILYGTQSGRPDKALYIDITGDEMVRLDSVANLDQHLVNRFVGPLSNGKYYMAGFVEEKESGRCLYEYDPATDTFTKHQDIYFMGMNTHNGVVTVENDDRLPGESIVNVVSNTATGKVDLYLYNLESRETVLIDGVSGEWGTPARLETIKMDPTGRYIIGGGYGTNSLGVLDTQTIDPETDTFKIDHYPTVDHQIDSAMFYDGYLWLGLYQNGQIVRFDMQTHEAISLSNMMNSVFMQRRMLNPTAGDGKVFFAGEPYEYRWGGILIWYDIEKDLTYVAAGPNPEDVYYAKTTASFVVWRNAVTHEIESFDEDGDGMYDPLIIDDDKGDEDPNNDISHQRFYGVVNKQVLAGLNYVDGYIIGCTTRNNGKTIVDTEGSPKLFIYDVNAMRLVDTYDITDAVKDVCPGTTLPSIVDAFKPDPYEKGKFWGVLGNTLFSCNVNFETLTFENVKEEVSFTRDIEYQYHKSHIAIDILFDGDWMYVGTQRAGTFMVNTAEPTTYYQISATPVSDMILLPDGNIAYLSKRDGVGDTVRTFKCTELTQPIILKSVIAVIEALPETVTPENEEQFMAAYNMYSNLIESTKEQVTNKDKLLNAINNSAVDQAAQADALIDAIGEVTLQSEDAILAARRYYESISAEAKALVTKLSVLEAAELTLLELQLDDIDQKQDDADNKEDPDVPGADDPVNNNDGKGGDMWLFIGIGAGVVVIAAAVVVVILLRKKKAASNEEKPDTEENSEE